MEDRGWVDNPGCTEVRVTPAGFCVTRRHHTCSMCFRINVLTPAFLRNREELSLIPLSHGEHFLMDRQLISAPEEADLSEVCLNTF